jgi:predicted nucleic acid-binding protein
VPEFPKDLDVCSAKTAGTGALYALLDRDEAGHQRVRDWWEGMAENVRVPVVVLPELAYLLSRRIGTSAELVEILSVGEGEQTHSTISGAARSHRFRSYRFTSAA